MFVIRGTLRSHRVFFVISLRSLSVLSKRWFICIIMSNRSEMRELETPTSDRKLSLPKKLHGLTVEASRGRNIES